ncbi:hypothetical protein ACLOJK_027421 [Asimina triloba]
MSLLCGPLSLAAVNLLTGFHDFHAPKGEGRAVIGTGEGGGDAGRGRSGDQEGNRGDRSRREEGERQMGNKAGGWTGAGSTQGWIDVGVGD